MVLFFLGCCLQSHGRHATIVFWLVETPAKLLEDFESSAVAVPSIKLREFGQKRRPIEGMLAGILFGV